MRFYSTLEGALPPHAEEKQVEPLGLSSQEQADLVAFLESLTDTALPAELLRASIHLDNHENDDSTQ